jgi:hypothetical protein
MAVLYSLDEPSFFHKTRVIPTEVIRKAKTVQLVKVMTAQLRDSKNSTSCATYFPIRYRGPVFDGNR